MKYHSQCSIVQSVVVIQSICIFVLQLSKYKSPEKISVAAMATIAAKFPISMPLWCTSLVVHVELEVILWCLYT